MISYEERARLKKRRAYFNSGAALYNMTVHAKATNNVEEQESLKAKIEQNDPEVKNVFNRISELASNENGQSSLAAKFKETADQLSLKRVAPRETGNYATNQAYYDDALLIGFLVDSKLDKGQFKDVATEVSLLNRLGKGEIETEADSRNGWQLEVA